MIIQEEALRRCNGSPDKLRFIHSLPTIDAVPVVHGRWVKGENWGVTCSECSCLAIAHDAKNYCPNCGAKMDGGAEDV